MQLAQNLASIWRRRSVRDAVVIAGICLATYSAASWFDILDRFYAFTRQHEAYELDEIIVVAFVFGFLMVIYTWRRAQDMNLEIQKRREAERKAADHALQLATAVNNIPQGITMYDSAERLVVCNDHYLQMYNLSRDIVKPGASLLSVFQHRVDVGLLKRDPEEYRAELLTLLAEKKVIRKIVETSDGREIAITDYPMANGSWVGVHEDRTEWRRREESFRLLFDSNPIPMWVLDCETLRFLAVNAAAVAQYGYSREQFLTMTVPDIRTDDHESSEAFIHALPANQDGGYVGQHRRADGTIIHVTAYSRLLIYENREARLAAISDITARKLAEDDVRRTKVFLDTVIESVPLPIVVKTAKDSRFTLINKASEELFGFRRDDVIGKTLNDIFPKERADSIAAQDRNCLLSGQPIVIRDHSISSAKGVRLVTSKKVVIPGDDGKPEYLLTLMDDVTERRQTEDQIVHMAHSDPLTDLPNRAAFNERLSMALKAAEAERRSFAILCMDLDGFKDINDIYGHAVGDALLCRIADRLRAVAAGVFVARLGGDEFTIIADNGDRSDIAKFTDRLLAAFVDDFEVDGHRLPQALSIGVAIYPANGADAKTLMNNADAALYQAKAAGSGSARFFKPEMAVRLRERAALQADLKSAIQHNELRLYYQPQLTMTGEITGFEALARWNSPKRGMVPPAEFIPLAEESSLILVLGEWVMREACREAASWDNPLNIAINARLSNSVMAICRR